MLGILNDKSVSVVMGLAGFVLGAFCIWTLSKLKRGARATATHQRPTITSQGAIDQQIMSEGIYGMMIVDATGKEKPWVNDTVVQMLGYSRNELNTLSLDSIWSSGDFENCTDFLRSVQRAARSGVTEVELIKRDNTRLPMMITGMPVTHEGKPYFALTLQDITALKAMHHRLLQTAKLASIGQLVAGVAHELNNPLGAIRLHAELIESSVAESKDLAEVKNEIQESLKSVDSCVDRMQKIIASLRQFSRNTNGKEFREADFNELIEQTLLLYGKRLRDEKINLELDLTNELPKVHMDPQQMEQVLINLLSNAVDAMANAPERKIRIQTRPHKGGVVCVVQDTGPGVPKANRDRIFDPFFTTKEVGKGTGLGLSLSYSIMKEHKGDITVSGEPGQGAVFTIWIPGQLYVEAQKPRAENARLTGVSR